MRSEGWLEGGVLKLFTDIPKASFRFPLKILLAVISVFADPTHVIPVFMFYISDRLHS